MKPHTLSTLSNSIGVGAIARLTGKTPRSVKNWLTGVTQMPETTRAELKAVLGDCYDARACREESHRVRVAYLDDRAAINSLGSLRCD